MLEEGEDARRKKSKKSKEKTKKGPCSPLKTQVPFIIADMVRTRKSSAFLGLAVETAFPIVARDRTFAVCISLALGVGAARSSKCRARTTTVFVCLVAIHLAVQASVELDRWAF